MDDYRLGSGFNLGASLTVSYQKTFNTGIFFLLAVAAVVAVWSDNWSNLFLIVVTASLSALPLYLHKKFNIRISAKLRTSILLFLVASLVLGQVNHFYTTYPWWDTMLHFTAGLGLTVFGLVLLRDVYSRGDVSATPSMTPFFAFCFTAMMAVVWEVYEFIIDSLGWSDVIMQASNTDTMYDLIAALVAALIVCVLGFRFLQYNEKNIAGQMIDESQTQTTKKD